MTRMHQWCLPFLAVLAFAGLIAGCSSTETTTTTEAPRSKETLYREGHTQYLQRAFDKAQPALEAAYGMDSTYADAAFDLASLHYDLAMLDPNEQGATRRRELTASRRFFARAEALGKTDMEVYERLCEISVSLDDDRGFLRYARKSVEKYPYDRQYYNLGIAYFNAADYQSVVKTQKEAVDKFKRSPYLGGFYRQMGRAYMKMDRDQTATKTLETGVKAVDVLLASLKKESATAKDDLRRLGDDRVALLQLLRRLHQTYKEEDKLRAVERELKDAGALK